MGFLSALGTLGAAAAAVCALVLLWGALGLFLLRRRQERQKDQASGGPTGRLAKSREFLQTVIDTIPECIMVLDRNHKVVLANRHAMRMSDKHPHCQDGCLCYRVSRSREAPCDREMGPCALELILQTRQPASYVHTFVDTDGHEKHYEISAAPIFDESGRIAQVIEACRDITDRRRLEADLRQAQKMEAVGRLAGGVAHDFRNQLTVIKGYCDLLLQTLPADSSDRAAIEQIAAAAERATATTTQLLAFSRKRELAPVVMDLNEVLSDLHGPLSRLIGEHVQMSVICCPGPCMVEADRMLLEQAVVNLAVNARDAMPGGGSLTLETSLAIVGEDEPRPGPGLVAGRYVVLLVRDTGVGMDKATRQHMFDPFFTTKEVGKGTGLGLSMVYGFVKQSGGRVEVASEVGKGTAVRVYLPWATSACAEDAAGLGRNGLPPGRETVLVVEDELTVRRIVVRVLRQCGYVVFEAGDAREALALESMHDGAIDLLVTDVVMPGMNGIELAKRLKARRKDVKTLFVSGYAESLDGQAEMLRPGLDFLSKPFSPSALAQAVRRLLDRDAESPASAGEASTDARAEK